MVSWRLALPAVASCRRPVLLASQGSYDKGVNGGAALILVRFVAVPIPSSSVLVDWVASWRRRESDPCRHDDNESVNVSEELNQFRFATETSGRPVSHGSSSAERWDAHKKPRAPPQADTFENDDVGESSSTGSNDMEVDNKPQLNLYAGPPGFFSPPEPSTLPMPSFL
ncbi:hypothetical protein EJB05_29450, partial [Eragrostis curvula]